MWVQASLARFKACIFCLLTKNLILKERKGNMFSFGICKTSVIHLRMGFDVHFYTQELTLNECVVRARFI